MERMMTKGSALTAKTNRTTRAARKPAA